MTNVKKKDFLADLQNNRKNLVPSPLQRREFKRFFDCAAKLMESQLLQACKCSLRDFVNYIVDGKVNICHSAFPSSTSSLLLRVIETLRETISINFRLSSVFQTRSLSLTLGFICISRIV